MEAFGAETTRVVASEARPFKLSRLLGSSLAVSGMCGAPYGAS